ncbi:hypothetical protein AOLI_G00139290 [Acnodon oligacanthus]
MQIATHPPWRYAEIPCSGGYGRISPKCPMSLECVFRILGQITIIPQFTVPNVQCRSCRPLYHVMALLQMKNSLDCRRKAHPSLRTAIGVGGRLETAGRCVSRDSKPRKMVEKEEGCQRAEQRGMNNAG